MTAEDDFWEEYRALEKKMTAEDDFWKVDESMEKKRPIRKPISPFPRPVEKEPEKDKPSITSQIIICIFILYVLFAVFKGLYFSGALG